MWVWVRVLVWVRGYLRVRGFGWVQGCGWVGWVGARQEELRQTHKHLELFHSRGAGEKGGISAAFPGHIRVGEKMGEYKYPLCHNRGISGATLAMK